MASPIFISYKHGDPSTRIARSLYEYLDAYSEALDIVVFMDNHALHGGDEWAQRIDRELAASTHFIALLDTAYWLSGECRRELRNAYERFVSTGHPKLLFVKAQEIRPDLLMLRSDGAVAELRTKGRRTPRVGDFHFLGPFDRDLRLVRLAWEDGAKLSDQLAALVNRFERMLPRRAS